VPPSLSIKIGGEAGQGVQSVSAMLARILQRLGLYVFACQDKESRIRGGHNFIHLAAGPQPLYAPHKNLDLLVCLDRSSIELHSEEVGEKGLVLYDEGIVTDAPDGENFFGLRLGDIAKEMTGSTIMANSVAVGAAVAWAHVEFDVLADQLKSYFAAKGDKVVTQNIAAAKAGYKQADGRLKKSRFKLELPHGKTETILIQGAHAIALGAIAAGCSFISAYPMSPATAILEYFFTHREDLGLVAVQAEDEIAAINMAIGASFAGVRAMTSTSGGGFSLMVEGLGLAGMTETPVVIVNAQRPGPSTGLPTRTEQGDLEFVIHASQGEFPRAVLTPGTAGQAFWAMVRAFNLAERYHIPVIVLVDQYLCDSIWTEKPFALGDVKIDRGPMHEPGAGKPAEYRRYELNTERAVVPRAFPGSPGALVYADSDEHDEFGRITEDAVMRKSQVTRRMIKHSHLKEEAQPPAFERSKKCEELIVCWGTTLGAAQAAVELRRRSGADCCLLHIEQAWPLATNEIIEAMGLAKRSVCVELNATGQMAHLIQAETGLSFDRSILKYDGRPFLPEELAEELEREN
jgi:2-oxoglutarate ferredoxin oxidoreductase subunit alpha